MNAFQSIVGVSFSLLGTATMGFMMMQAGKFLASFGAADTLKNQENREIPQGLVPLKVAYLTLSALDPKYWGARGNKRPSNSSPGVKVYVNELGLWIHPIFHSSKFFSWDKFEWINSCEYGDKVRVSMKTAGSELRIYLSLKKRAFEECSILSTKALPGENPDKALVVAARWDRLNRLKTSLPLALAIVLIWYAVTHYLN